MTYSWTAYIWYILCLGLCLVMLWDYADMISCSPWHELYYDYYLNSMVIKMHDISLSSYDYSSTHRSIWLPLLVSLLDYVEIWFTWLTTKLVLLYWILLILHHLVDFLQFYKILKMRSIDVFQKITKTSRSHFGVMCVYFSYSCLICYIWVFFFSLMRFRHVHVAYTRYSWTLVVQ